MPRPRTSRRPPVALAVLLAAFLLSFVAVVAVGRPNRPMAADEGTARVRGPGRPVGRSPAAEGGARPTAAAPTAAVPPAPAAPTPPAPRPTAPPPPPPPAAPSGSYRVVEVKDGGTITGTCRADRDVALWEVERNKDNDKGCGAAKQPTERVLVGPDRALSNCVVYLRQIRAGKDFPPAMRGEERRLLVDQKACRYVPHVSWMREATQIAVGNSDLAEHNIHGFKESLAVTQFNFSSPPQSTKDDEEAAYLPKTGLYILKCDIHPWMSGYVHVTPHPYFDVTPATGKYALTDVPPGEWEVVCWHEGMKEEPVVVNGKINGYTYGPDFVSPPQKVTVAPGATAMIDFVVPVP